MTDLERNKKMGALYSGFLNRLSDSDGFQFWSDQLDSGAELLDVSQSFFVSEEGQGQFAGVDNKELVNTMFVQLFDREAGKEGLDYWTSELESGSVAEGHLMMALINGAQGIDERVVESKGEASAAYAKAGFNDLEFASQFDEAIGTVANDTRNVPIEFSNTETPTDELFFSAEGESGVEYTASVNQGRAAEEVFGGIIAEGDQGEASTIGFDGTAGLGQDLSGGLLV